ncbi:MAG: hypothetical protein AB7S74_15980 [Hyphomicrobium sp.]
MKDRYGIPGDVLAELRRRDKNCVYCGVLMPDKRSDHPLDFATIEHLYPAGDDPTWVSWCCNGCNIRHKKPLREWFKSEYCIERGINENTVAPIIRQFLASGLKEQDQLWLEGREHRFINAAPWSEPLEDGQQSIHRPMLPEPGRQSFDRIVFRICDRKYAKTYPFEFRGLEPRTFGRYYGFMYWPTGDALNRVPFPD